GEPIPASLPTRLVVAVDAFGFADAETAAALQPMVRKLSALVKEVREDLLAPPGLSVWARAQRTLQPYEAWLTFKDWVDRDNPRFAFNVARTLVFGSAIPESERQWAAMMRAEARARLAWLLPPWTILCGSEEHTSELQSRRDLVCRLLLEKKKKRNLDLIA